MSIKCCYKCTRPWKTPGCHDFCEVYLKEKKIHDEKREAERAQRNRETYLNGIDWSRDMRIRKSKVK